jgi:hypothetical protein
VILPSAEAAIAVVLWIAATHAQPAWQHAPRLVIRAPNEDLRGLLNAGGASETGPRSAGTPVPAA